MPSTPGSSSDGKSFPRIRKFAKWMQETSRKRLGSTDDLKDDVAKKEELINATSFESVDKFEHNSVDTSERGDGTTPAGTPTASAGTVTAPTDELSESTRKAIAEEPLVGFWSWENTMRVHKIKMHVAEGSDLALHVVLAIVTNQLRMERNVIVSTV